MDTWLYILAIALSPQYQALVQQTRDAHTLVATWTLATRADAVPTLAYDCLLIDAALPDAELHALLAAAHTARPVPAIVALLPAADAPLPVALRGVAAQVLPAAGLTPGVLAVVIRSAVRAQRAEQHIDLLADASRALAASHDVYTNLAQLAGRVVGSFADWCAIDVIEDGGHLTRIALAATQAAARMTESYQPTAVLAAGQTQFYPDVAAASADALTDAQRAALQQINEAALISVPLRARAQTLGALTLARHSSALPYTEADRATAEELARRVAMAVDNGHLYRTAQDAIRSRDVFLSVAAHDLKTPLTTLLGYATLLQRRLQNGTVQPERDARAIDNMVTQAKRLSTLLNTLLDLSRMPHNAVKLDQHACDFAALIQRVVDQTRATAPGHTLDLDVPGEPILVFGDAERLELVVRNLVQNAIQHSPPGGAISVRLTHTADQSQFAVQDQGIGIPRDVLPRIFSRFNRAADANVYTVTSMGIGLYIVKQIVELHGGAVGVQSAEGQGSTFTVTLPLHPRAEPAAAAP